MVTTVMGLLERSRSEGAISIPVVNDDEASRVHGERVKIIGVVNRPHFKCINLPLSH